MYTRRRTRVLTHNNIFNEYNIIIIIIYICSHYEPNLPSETDFCFFFLLQLLWSPDPRVSVIYVNRAGTGCLRRRAALNVYNIIITIIRTASCTAKRTRYVRLPVYFQNRPAAKPNNNNNHGTLAENIYCNSTHVIYRRQLKNIMFYAIILRRCYRCLPCAPVPTRENIIIICFPITTRPRRQIKMRTVLIFYHRLVLHRIIVTNGITAARRSA